ncbi:MAG: sterol desaturase family protein [Phormidesmis sp.]
MTSFDGAILATFWLLLTVNISRPQGWQQLCQKSRADWTLDLFGLSIQGVVIPAMQIGLLYKTFHWLLPQAAHCIALPPLAGFFFCTILVDYAYYWNHRWLHSRAWALHRVHHTVTQLDILGTSRNSLWSSFFILYLWVHALMIYLLHNPSGYLWGITLTAMLDLWRHSQLGPRPNGWLYAVLSPWLVLPQDHAYHHANWRQAVNFGANLKVWDRLHHTAYNAHSLPNRLAQQTPLNLWQQLFYPFELR